MHLKANCPRNSKMTNVENLVGQACFELWIKIVKNEDNY